MLWWLLLLLLLLMYDDVVVAVSWFCRCCLFLCFLSSFFFVCVCVSVRVGDFVFFIFSVC